MVSRYSHGSGGSPLERRLPLGRIASIVLSTLLIGASFASMSAADAAPSGACRRFELVERYLTWDDAAEAARTMGGHLAAIDNVREERCAEALVWSLDGDKTAWLGGTDRVVEGVWRWVDARGRAPVFYDASSSVGRRYTNFIVDEPNNCCGGQDCLDLSAPYWLGRDDYLGWDDTSCDAELPFIVEY